MSPPSDTTARPGPSRPDLTIVLDAGDSPSQQVPRRPPVPVKILVSVIAIAPAAFFMGVPFPTGLGKLQENGKNLLPWAYGVNGALSVTGSLLASVVSMHWGYLFVLAIALVLYLGAGLLFPVNLRGGPRTDG